MLHHAAIPSVQHSVEDPLASHQAGITATLHLLVAARDAGVKRLVFASSSAVYGDSPELPHHEKLLPQPKSPYAVTKLAAEHYCRVFTEIYGLETVSLRYFNVFGPRQDPSSPYSAVISIFIKKMLAGEAPVIYGDGLQSRDFIFVGNNVTANLLAATGSGAAGAVFNIASGQRYSLLDLVGKLNTILGTQFEPVFAPARAGEIRHSQATIARAEQELGFELQTDFEAGLEKTVAWYQANKG